MIHNRQQVENEAADNISFLYWGKIEMKAYLLLSLNLINGVFRNVADLKGIF